MERHGVQSSGHTVYRHCTVLHDSIPAPAGTRITQENRARMPEEEEFRSWLTRTPLSLLHYNIITIILCSRKPDISYHRLLVGYYSYHGLTSTGTACTQWQYRTHIVQTVCTLPSLLSIPPPPETNQPTWQHPAPSSTIQYHTVLPHHKYAKYHNSVPKSL